MIMSTPTVTPDDEPLNDLDWLSKYIKTPKKTIYSWRLVGKGPPAYHVGQQLRYRRSDVDQWLAEHQDERS